MIPVHVLIKTDRSTEIEAMQSVTNALERAGYDVLAVNPDGTHMIAAEPDLRDLGEDYAERISPPGSGTAGLMADVLGGLAPQRNDVVQVGFGNDAVTAMVREVRGDEVLLAVGRTDPGFIVSVESVRVIFRG